MKQTVMLTDTDGQKRELTEKQHPAWDNLGDPCPECDATEYRHFTAEGARYGIHQDVVIQRNDYWGTDCSLMTQCLSCDVVLYRHPAFELLYGDSDKLESE